MNYAEDLASRLPAGFTKDAEIVDAAYNISEMEVGRKTTNYNFYMDEDFASDLITAYSALQQSK
jgi:hypothetical protein